MDIFADLELEVPTTLVSPQDFTFMMEQHQKDAEYIINIHGANLEDDQLVALSSLHMYMNTIENPFSDKFDGVLHGTYAAMLSSCEGDFNTVKIDYRSDLSSEYVFNLNKNLGMGISEFAMRNTREYINFVIRCAALAELRKSLDRLHGERV